MRRTKCCILGVLFVLGGLKILTPSGCLFGCQQKQQIFQDILRNEPTCQRTKIFPFLVGCPEHCDRAIDKDEPMYRMTLEWYFGQPDQYPLDHPTAYQKGINFQCPDHFVEKFQNAATSLYSSLEKALPNATGTLYMKRQRQMHMSLSYLCCLRRNKTDWAREAMYQWVQKASPFNFDVAFDSIQ